MWLLRRLRRLWPKPKLEAVEDSAETAISGVGVARLKSGDILSSDPGLSSRLCLVEAVLDAHIEGRSRSQVPGASAVL